MRRGVVRSWIVSQAGRARYAALAVAEKWADPQVCPTLVGCCCVNTHFPACERSDAPRVQRHGSFTSLISFTALFAFVSIACITSAHAAEPSDAPTQAVLFRTGDMLPGKVESLVPGKELRWIHPDAEKPIRFRADNLAQIANRSTRHPPEKGGQPCVAVFTNLDEMRGDFVSFDATNLVLRTWHAGLVTIPRDRVRLIRPIPTHFKTAYAGPTGIEDWTIGNVHIDDAGEWTYANGAFYATKAASIARIVNLPDKSTLEFDIAWRETFNVAIALYTDYLHPISLRNKETEPAFGGFYSLQINPRTVNLLHVTKREPLRYLGPLAVTAFAQKSKARITIRCDKSRHSVSLFIDGQMIKQWIDDRGFGGEGRGIRLVHQGIGSVRVSNLRVTEWDGRFDVPPSLPPNSAQDVTLTSAGQRVFGHVETIRPDVVIMRIGGGTKTIPWRDAAHIELAPAKAAPLTPEAGMVRGWFEPQRSVKFRLEKWENGRITGTSPNFGTVAFDADAFQQVEFSAR